MQAKRRRAIWAAAWIAFIAAGLVAARLHLNELALHVAERALAHYPQG